MWFSPNFTKRRIPRTVHEDASQEIQGGLAGEHYHLSAAELAAILELVNTPVYLEPVVTNAGVIITGATGDIITARLSL